MQGISRDLKEIVLLSVVYLIIEAATFTRALSYSWQLKTTQSISVTGSLSHATPRAAQMKLSRWLPTALFSLIIQVLQTGIELFNL